MSSILSPVIVFKSYNIVLAEIGAGLYFNEHQRNVAGVFDTMLCSDGDICRLIFRVQAFFPFDFDFRRTAIETGVNCLTSLDTARALVGSLETKMRSGQMTLVDIAQLDREKAQEHAE